MKMYTASLQYLAGLKQEFPNYLFVSIARGKACNEQCDASYPKLAPSWELLSAYRNGASWDYYEVHYNKQLAELNPHTVFEELKELALTYNKKVIVLVCYEKSDIHCHRRLVAKWYNNLGCNVEELLPKTVLKLNKPRTAYGWKETEPITGSLKIINNECEANAVLNSDNKYGKLIVLYTGWSEQTTRALARRYCSGTAVQIGDTKIKSKRFPRPYLPNATEDELAEIKRIEHIQNNKTCYAFIKEVGYILAKAYDAKPYDLTLAYNTGYRTKYTTRRDEDNIPCKIKISVPTVPTQLQNAHYEIEMYDERFPQTRSLAQFVEGVEKAFDETDFVVDDTKATLQTDIDIRRKLYAEDLDYNKYRVTRLVAPTKEFLNNISDKPDPNDTQTQKKKNKIFYVPVTEEIITWDYGYRTTTYNGNRTVSKSAKVYASDVKTDLSTEKMQECKEVLDWLEQHDMIDLHAYKCPSCGNTANTSTGCEHCGYELPKDAREHFNKGRLSAEELNNMTAEEVNKIFADHNEDVCFEDWRTKSLNKIY